MAEKPIKGSEIIEDGALQKITTDFKGIFTLLEQNDAKLKSMAENAKEVAKGFSAMNSNDLSAALAKDKEMTAAAINAEKVNRARIQTEKAMLSLTNQKAKAVTAETNAYTQQSKELTRLRNEYKNLAAQNKANTKEARALLNEINKLDGSLKKIDATVGQHTRKVGQYENALKGVRGTIGTVRSALGSLGLAVGSAMIFQDGIKTLINFDERLADIAKTTGLTVEGARELSNELLKIDTRSSVDALQEMAVAAGRLGIEGKQNIIDFVNAADKTFVALGDDLGGTADEIATSLGKIASVFGDEAKFGIGDAILKTGSVLNELSANSKASAGNILDFTNRMAGVASVAGIAQTDIQALGAFFDDAGQSIEVAATTLNVLLPQLSKDQERFAKVAGLTADEFGAMLKNAPIEALKAVAVGSKSSEGGLNGLVQTLEGFGIEAARGAAIVGTLANGVDTLTELQGYGVSAFKEMTSVTNEFNIKNQTTAALLEKLKKEWDKQILGIGGTTAASEKFKGVLTFLTKNLGTILDVTFKLGKAFIVYKTTMLAMNVATKAQNALEAIRTGGLKSMFVQQTAVNSATNQGVKSIKLLGVTMNAMPWGLLLTGLTMLVTEFLNMESASDAAARALDNVTESTKLLNEEILLAIENTKTQYEDNITKRIETLKNAGKTEKEIQSDITSNYVTELEKRKKALEEILAPETGVSMMTMDVLAQSFQQGQQMPLDNPMGVNPNQKTKYQAVVDDARNARIEAFKKELDEINLLLESEEARAENAKKLVDNYKEVNAIEGKINSNRGKGVKELSEMAKLEAELAKLQLERSNLIIKQGGNESDRTLELKAQSDELKLQIERYKEIIEGAKKVDNSKEAKRITDQLGRERELDETIDRRYMSDEEADLYDRQKQFEQELQIAGNNLELQRKLRVEYEKDVLKIKEEYAEKAAKIQEEEDLKIREQQIADQIQLAQDLTDITTFLVDKRIEAIDREIEAEKRKYEESKQRANEIIAMRELDSNSMAESLAFEKAEQAKAMAEQEKLQRRKQRLEMFNTAVNLMNSQIAQGNGEPLAKTMADVTALMAFIRSIPAFWDGTETNVGDAVGTKFSNGRDGIISRLDESEIVLNKEKADKLAKMGITTTDQIIQAAAMSYRGGLVGANTTFTAVPMFDNSSLEAKLEETNALLKSINNKPHYEGYMKQMGSVITIVEKMSTPKKNVDTIKYKKLR